MSEVVLERNKGCVSLTICDPSLEFGIKPEWGVGNHLILAGFRQESRPKTDFKGPFSIHEVQWDTAMANVYARMLVSESNGVFLTLQKLMAVDEDNPSVKRQQLVKISHKYRSVIKACVDHMQLNADSISDDLTLKGRLEEQSQVLFKIELVWNLCEIMFIDIQPVGALLARLVDWIRWHFPECETWVKDVMESDDPPRHPSYWNAIFGYVLQGRIDEVRKLLRVGRTDLGEELASMDRLLNRMPVFSHFSSLSEFDLHWQKWHEECQLTLDRGTFQLSPNLDKMCRLLCGKMDTFLEMTSLCETWYHLMVSNLLYTNPCVTVSDLCDLAHEYVDMFGGLLAVGDLDRILLAAFEFNALEVVKESSQNLESWWFAAHLTDLLRHVGNFDPSHDQGQVSLREFLLLDYASGLASHGSMWQFAVDYFDHCPTYGLQMMETFLERISLQSEMKANKILDIAVKRNMTELANTVCKLSGRKALQNGRLGSALSWAIKSKDVQFSTFLAEHFISEYVRSGQFYAPSLLDNLGPSVLYSDKLTFLGKYREFQNCYSNKKLKEAANLLVSLISSRFAPKSLWLALLLDAIPLLESEEMQNEEKLEFVLETRRILFDAEQTYELLYFLEELSSTKPNDESELDPKTKTLRLAIGRNLMRAHAQN